MSLFYVLARVVKDVFNLPLQEDLNTPPLTLFFFTASSFENTATLYYSFTIMSMNVFAHILPEWSGRNGYSFQRTRCKHRDNLAVGFWPLAHTNQPHQPHYLSITPFFTRVLLNYSANPTGSQFPDKAGLVSTKMVQLRNCSIGSPKVENIGFEPMTPCLQSRCSSQLS